MSIDPASFTTTINGEQTNMTDPRITIQWGGKVTSFADYLTANPHGGDLRMIVTEPRPRPTCGTPDPTNHGTCRMLPNHGGMHVGPVDGRHEAWHEQETT
ncbi:hypothetical protein [Clavibacter capsici]|uniref:hypothetical protein n=1 Tax=Clavibacter capsici TaxID=1874630 RepID=UPI001428076A|nr:hypothetical protein [Clavibacter capsici]QIS38639.1 hypothetical protein GW572_04500 [Clavibacter capsici]